MIAYTHTGTAAIFNSKTEGVDKSGLKALNSKIKIKDFESVTKKLQNPQFDTYEYKNTKILKL